MLLGPGRVNQHMASSLLAARVSPAMSRDETPGSRPFPLPPPPPTRPPTRAMWLQPRASWISRSVSAPPRWPHLAVFSLLFFSFFSFAFYAPPSFYFRLCLINLGTQLGSWQPACKVRFVHCSLSLMKWRVSGARKLGCSGGRLLWVSRR